MNRGKGEKIQVGFERNNYKDTKCKEPDRGNVNK